LRRSLSRRRASFPLSVTRFVDKRRKGGKRCGLSGRGGNFFYES